MWRRLNASRLYRTISGEYAFASTNPRVLAEGAYFYGQSHGSAERQPLPPSTFTVTILRDPVRRAHSLYDFLVAGDLPGSPSQIPRHERAWAADGFDAFLERVPPQHLLNQLWMFSTKLDVSEAAARVATCSSVLFTEDFAARLPELGDQFGLSLPVLRARVTSARSELTEPQTERLRQLLAPEYELLERLADRGIAPGKLRSTLDPDRTCGLRAIWRRA